MKKIRGGRRPSPGHQGLYNGLLLFGVTKGDNGVPIAHPDTSAGLHLIFNLASQGKSDRQVAMAMNAEGYRTAGNSGGKTFSKDSVRGVLTNRFYVGQLRVPSQVVIKTGASGADL